MRYAWASGSLSIGIDAGSVGTIGAHRGSNRKERAMTGKERATFRSQANQITAIFQIGKDNITPQLTQAVDAALTKRELIKLSVLETSEQSAKEAAQTLSERTGSEVIQCIGRKFVLYRKKPEE